VKQAIRTGLAGTLGIGTLLAGQLAIENSAWWLTGTTATFDDPLLNMIKFAVAGSVGLVLALNVGLRPRGRGRLP